MVKPGLNGLDSLFLVPGDEAEFEATKDVPHGEVRAAWYRSGTLGTPRRLHVYTPPGYEEGSDKYPVLYLLHGAGDEDAGWSTIGRAGFILDNLIAAKQAVPMIVVMTNGSLPPPKNPPARPAPGEAPSPEFRAAMEALQNRFTDELLKEVVPFVEKTYRVKAEPEGRALAGLSMGGGQTLRVLTTNPDRFAYVGVWSAGLFGGNAEEWEKRNEAFLSAADKVNGSVKRLEICVGDKDFALNGSKALAGVLEKRKVKHEVHISGGGHTWINWRHYLNGLERPSCSGDATLSAGRDEPGVEGEIPRRRAVPFDRDLAAEHRPVRHRLVPDDHLLRAGRHVADFERAPPVGDGEVGMIEDQPPGRHPGVEVVEEPGGDRVGLAGADGQQQPVPDGLSGRGHQAEQGVELVAGLRELVGPVDVERGARHPAVKVVNDGVDGLDPDLGLADRRQDVGHEHAALGAEADDLRAGLAGGVADGRRPDEVDERIADAPRLPIDEQPLRQDRAAPGEELVILHADGHGLVKLIAPRRDPRRVNEDLGRRRIAAEDDATPERPPSAGVVRIGRGS